MFIVTYTDYSDTCDGHSRYMGSYATRDAAQAAINADVAGFQSRYGTDAIYYEVSNEIWASDDEIGKVGCVWDIHEIPSSDLSEVLKEM